MPKNLISKVASSPVTPKVIGAAVTAGFAAAGVAAVVAQNLRTISDDDAPLAERAKKVGQNSVGAILSGPAGLIERGKLITGRGDDQSDEPEATTAPEAPVRTKAQTESEDEAPAVTAAKTIADAAEKKADSPEKAAAKKTPAKKAPTEKSTAKKSAPKPKSASEKTASKSTLATEEKPSASTLKTASNLSKAQSPAAETASPTDEKSGEDKSEKAKATTTAQSSSGTPEKQSTPKTKTTSSSATSSEKSDTSSSNGKTPTPKTSTEKSSGKKSDSSSSSKGTSETKKSADENTETAADLKADLEMMTVSQLKERAQNAGLPGRSKMNKDELIAALAEREAAN